MSVRDLHPLKEWELPEVLNTDKAPTYAAAIAQLIRFPELWLIFPLMLQPPRSRAATRGASRVCAMGIRGLRYAPSPLRLW